MSADSQDFTKGSITGKLIRFMIPVLFALILQAMYGAIDMAIVGQFGSTEGIAGVAIGSSVMHAVTVVIAGLATGMTVLIARYIGEKHPEEIGPLIGGSVWLFSVLILAITAVLLFFPGIVASLMQTPLEAMSHTGWYLRICGLGSVFIIGYNVIGAMFRGMGDSRSPLLFVAIACGVNITGDLLFVAALKMDAAGAAIATVISQAVSVVLSFRFMKKRGMPFKVHLSDVRYNKQAGAVIRIGSPMALQELLTQVSFLVLSALINTLGLLASSGYGVACKILAFIMLVPAALMQSMSSFVSQNVGAKKENRARKALFSGIGFGMIIGVAAGASVFFFGDHLAAVFTPDASVIAQAWEYLRGVSPEAVLTVILFSFIGYFNGHNRTLYVLLQGIAQTFIVRLPMAFLMSRRPDATLYGISLAVPAATLFGIILHLFYYRHLSRIINRDQS